MVCQGREVPHLRFMSISWLISLHFLLISKNFLRSPGLEELCARLLEASAPGCVLKLLPSGAVDGEASVGKLLLSAPGAGRA